MSLKFNNRATPKQEVLLTDLGYIKTSNNWPLTQDQAAQIIEELFEQKRQEEIAEAENWGRPGKYGDPEDPFSDINK